MRRVFDGKTTQERAGKHSQLIKYQESSGCGCTCIPSTGSLGSNKPTVQVKW